MLKKYYSVHSTSTDLVKIMVDYILINCVYLLGTAYDIFRVPLCRNKKTVECSIFDKFRSFFLSFFCPCSDFNAYESRHIHIQVPKNYPMATKKAPH